MGENPKDRIIRLIQESTPEDENSASGMQSEDADSQPAAPQDLSDQDLAEHKQHCQAKFREASALSPPYLKSFGSVLLHLLAIPAVLSLVALGWVPPEFSKHFPLLVIPWMLYVMRFPMRKMAALHDKNQMYRAYYAEHLRAIDLIEFDRRRAG